MMKRIQRFQRYFFPNIEALSGSFANYAENLLTAALERQQSASLVVPGGNTPRHYLPALARKPLLWNRITITLSDERWVESTSDDSNERLVKTYLLDHLTENTQFIGLKTGHDAPDAALDEIDQRLKAVPQPFTLTVLGLGEDGHIASLFPGLEMHKTSQPAIEHQCIAVHPPIAPSLRISLSLEAVANSQQIALVVTGKTKRQLLDSIEKQTDPAIPLVWLLQNISKPVTVFEMD